MNYLDDAHSALIASQQMMEVLENRHKKIHPEDENSTLTPFVTQDFISDVESIGHMLGVRKQVENLSLEDKCQYLQGAYFAS